eukprot:GILI01026647.1.p1 GENE.GILI01026647.1~~GILI01026647.1.p1  ORF type:complete len:184 (+),score=45.26 GILI01026647.1:35-586(+)
MFKFVQDLFFSLLRRLGLWGKSCTIVFLGLENAGKTTMLHRLSSGNISVFPPTMIANDYQIQIGNVSIRAWDVGGYHVARKLWRDHYMEAAGIFFLVDSSDADHFEEAKVELAKILRDAGDIPIAVLLNKCDMTKAVSVEEGIELLGLADVLKRNERRLQVFRTSSARRVGLLEPLQWMSELV